MLWGFYNTSVGSARDLELISRLGRPAPEAEVVVRDRLALGWSPDPDITCAEVDGVTCVVDGRLYEPATLARELGVSGTSAAELLARAYRREDDAMLTELRGRYSVALWDSVRQQGLLSCDLLATRPLFFLRGTGWIAFATEVTELLTLLPSRPGPDAAAFGRWLGSGGDIPQGRTLFEGVMRLRPGQLVDLRPGAAETRHYWRPHYAGTSRGSRDDHADGLREKLDQAVRRRLSPSKSGVVLSGGLDSSVVTAVAEAVKPDGVDLQTYSTVFPDYPDLDEGWKVRSLTEALGIEAAAYELEPQGALWFALTHAKRWDEPLQGAGALIEAPMVAKAAEDGADVVLDGQTGDEVLGFSPYVIADRMMRGRLLAASRLASRWPGLDRPATREEQRYVLKHVGLKGAAPYWTGRIGRDRRAGPDPGPEWLLPESRRHFAAAGDKWAWKAAASGPRWWRYLSDTLIEMPHRIARFDYLRHRAGAVGVVNESPLYDFDLVDYCLRLPPDLAFDGSRLSRPLAREAMRNVIPDDVRLNDRKANFSPFCFDMLTGADEAGIGRLLTAPDAEIGAYVDLDWVRKRWHDRPERGPRTTMAWGTVIWILTAAEAWLRAQADPGFIDEMLSRPDVRPPSLHRAIPADSGTFSRLAGGEKPVYG
jgi:asparagine synthase (glutamine-hydrolysing)